MRSATLTSIARAKGWVSVALAVALAASLSVAVLTLSPSAANAVSNTPVYGSQVIGPGCGANSSGSFFTIDNPDVPSTVSSGDYTGNTTFGNSASPTCTNSTWYDLDRSGSATITFEWTYGEFGGIGSDLHGMVCSVWAYIPTADAGDRHARYDIWGVQSSTGNTNWLFWPGNTIDQENTSGWIYLGAHGMGADNGIEVTLGNSDPVSPGWYTGAGAMAFSCVPPPLPPTPTGVTVVATGPSTVHVSWAGDSGANTQYIVTNGDTNSPTLGYGSASYDWTAGLSPGKYMCFAVIAENLSGFSAWSPYACLTVPAVPPVPANVTAVAVTASTVHISWTDNSGGTAQFVVSNGNVSSPVQPTGHVSYDWTGLSPGTYMCFTVKAQNTSGGSAWSPYACVTTWTETTALNDLIGRIDAVPSGVQPGILAGVEGMDTAKIIQVGGTYYAAYSPGSVTIRLASSPNPAGPWTPITTLDDSGASQPYLAQEPDKSFLLADEYKINPFQSAVKLRHFANLQALTSGQSDYSIQTSLTLSSCNEGTPDIHGISSDGKQIDVGLHYNSDCSTGLDREAFAHLTIVRTNPLDLSWTTTKDTARDTALMNAGFPGKHGGRDDIIWHGFRYSLQEAQNTSDTSLFTNWRLAVYDYGDRSVHKVTLNIPATCAGNPKLTLVSDPAGQPVLVVTAFIFGGSKGCVSGAGGELIYSVPAR